MIVVDTNILAYMAFPGKYTQTVVTLHEVDPQWEVPVLWRSEFLNVVCLYFRKGLIDYLTALDAIERAKQLIGERVHVVSHYAVMEFIQQSACSSYDCEFIALADRLGANLITFDKQIIREFPGLAMTPEDYIKKTRKKE